MPKLELMPEGFNPFASAPPSANVENRIGESPQQVWDEEQSGLEQDAAVYAANPQHIAGLGEPSTSPLLSQQAGIEGIPTASAGKAQDHIPQGYPVIQQFAPNLNDLAGQRFAMADEPPPPTGGRKPLADPIRPQPLVPKGLKYGNVLANQRGPAFQERLEDVERLMELMSKGKNQREIAQELGVGERTVRRFQSEQLGTQQKATEIQKDPELIKQYQQMVKQGYSLTQMARKLNKNEGSVSRHLKILNKSGDIKWIPEGGTRDPSMPTFKFKDKPGEVDDDYIKALEQYLMDIKAYYQTNGHAYA